MFCVIYGTCMKWNNCKLATLNDFICFYGIEQTNVKEIYGMNEDEINAFIEHLKLTKIIGNKNINRNTKKRKFNCDNNKTRKKFK